MPYRKDMDCSTSASDFSTKKKPFETRQWTFSTIYAHIPYVTFWLKKVMSTCPDLDVVLPRCCDKVGISFLQGLNQFQRYAYVRQAHAKEKKTVQQQQESRMEANYSLPGGGTYVSRVHSNSVVNGNF